MKKNARSGGKFSGNHTTLIDTSIVLVDIAAKYPEVKTISPGVIKAHEGRGPRRIKLSNIQGGILLKVRDGSSVQEVRLYTYDSEATMSKLTAAAVELGIPVNFDKNQSG